MQILFCQFKEKSNIKTYYRYNNFCIIKLLIFITKQYKIGIMFKIK